ncbi:Txe/YoeB family addiction module toxin [Thiorhodovibrio winogradskyi]|uniref:Txe/YoeB family addiction module toxin n=1 Tax=Thiorhodovibrio winogradskyi TaxID=77007 RepID=UPI002E2871B1|nr:Txe/YoeB family addiction module toxin [Thiorhodovibrio winogradskyi]
MLDFMDACLRDPSRGIGKPEPLKHLGSDVWSRRLTREHRCVYSVPSLGVCRCSRAKAEAGAP